MYTSHSSKRGTAVAGSGVMVLSPPSDGNEAPFALRVPGFSFVLSPAPADRSTGLSCLVLQPAPGRSVVPLTAPSSQGTQLFRNQGTLWTSVKNTFLTKRSVSQALTWPCLGDVLH